MREMRNGNWSAQELDRLRILYPQGGERHASRLLRRSVASVRKRATQLYRRKTQKGSWERDEDDRLRLSYGILNLRGLCLVLARSRKEVQERIRHLREKRRRGPWVRDEENLLKRIYPNRSDEDLEVCVSRSRAQIAKMAARLCLAKDKRFTAAVASPSTAKTRMPRWSSDDVDRLGELYPDRENLEIAQTLGRSVASVANKASQLGLKKALAMLRGMGRRNVAGRYR